MWQLERCLLVLGFFLVHQKLFLLLQLLSEQREPFLFFTWIVFTFYLTLPQVFLKNLSGLLAIYLLTLSTSSVTLSLKDVNPIQTKTLLMYRRSTINLGCNPLRIFHIFLVFFYQFVQRLQSSNFQFLLHILQ